MEEIDRVRKFMSYMRGNISAFTANTTDDVMLALVSEGYLESVGEKFDATRKKIVIKYRRVRPEESSEVCD